MKLFIDIGNSRLKWAAWDGRSWTAEGSIRLDTEPLTEWIGAIPRPEGIWIASVSAEDRVARVVDACEAALGLAPVRLRTQAEACGVRCAYAEPARLGVDRWLAVVAAFRECGAAIVFDCGTAITVDAVTITGEHLGGLIMPGIGLMRCALYGSTAGIPDEGDEGDVGLLARDTRSAVSGGSLYAAVAFMQHVAAELRSHLGAGTRVLLTGGDAERVRPLLSADVELRPRLVMEGMLAVVEERE